MDFFEKQEVRIICPRREKILTAVSTFPALESTNSSLPSFLVSCCKCSCSDDHCLSLPFSPTLWILTYILLSTWYLRLSTNLSVASLSLVQQNTVMQIAVAMGILAVASVAGGTPLDQMPGLHSGNSQRDINPRKALLKVLLV